MRTLLFSVVLLTIFFTSLSANPKAAANQTTPTDNLTPIQVMSFNIRMDTQADGVNQWSNRKDMASNALVFYDVDICGAQEVLHHQLTDMLERLPGYASVGVGREDGKTKGEYSPILYKKDRFTLLDSGNFWLAEELNTPGIKGWDAACERIATWAILKDNQTGISFFVLNTHLDHMGKIARHESAELLLNQINQLGTNLPVIVTGDFNATPDDDPILVLMNTENPKALKHTRDLAALTYGPDWTFHNYGKIPFRKRDWIDYIFVKGNFEVLTNGVLTDTHDELYLSDHCPVLVSLIIK